MAPKTIHVYEIDEYASGGNVLFVDVRSSGEFRQGHMEGAVNIPINDFEKGFERVLRHRIPGRTIILYCNRGSSSMYAGRLLARKGIQVTTIIEGIHGYQGKYWRK